MAKDMRNVETTVTTPLVLIIVVSTSEVARELIPVTSCISNALIINTNG